MATKCRAPLTPHWLWHVTFALSVGNVPIVSWQRCAPFGLNTGVPVRSTISNYSGNSSPPSGSPVFPRRLTADRPNQGSSRGPATAEPRSKPLDLGPSLGTSYRFGEMIEKSFDSNHVIKNTVLKVAIGHKIALVSRISSSMPKGNVIANSSTR